MKNNFGKILFGTSIALGLSIVTANTAQAGTITSVDIGGTAANDYFVYESDGTNTSRVLNPTSGDINQALVGDSSNPGGNIELAASSEQGGFDFTKNTTLEGEIGGKDITLSSLTLSDWTSTYKNTGLTFGEYWFNSALTANGFGILVGSGLFNTFQAQNGFQRFSDPNISYVNQDYTTGDINIGLAGHLNAAPMILGPDPMYGLVIQASEIVKYTYNGTTDYLFSFTGTNSDLVSDDGTHSHNANYNVTIPAKTPEPSAILGLLGVIGMFAAQRRKKVAS
ncbi:MAG: PEP-CTERM sorting domain-containing protein [Sphaerospermopsis sp. SIO1G2]|nr:PEP-CTERM sorting domain-containing protein [Sphaerospermopsis sp. SIO1G2]